jgi:hypothetical protein
MGSGATGGFVGASLGDILPQEAWWNSPVSSTAGAVSSFGLMSINSGRFDAGQFGIALGSSVASSVATTLASKAPDANAGRWLERVEHSGDYRLTAAAKGIMRPYYQDKMGVNLDAMRYRFASGILNGAAPWTVGNRVNLPLAAWNTRVGSELEQFKLLAHETAHTIQYDQIGDLTGAGIPNFLGRYFFAQPRIYDVPPALDATAIDDVNPISMDYTLDQSADRIRDTAVERLKKAYPGIE